MMHLGSNPLNALRFPQLFSGFLLALNQTFFSEYRGFMGVSLHSLQFRGITRGNSRARSLGLSRFVMCVPCGYQIYSLVQSRQLLNPAEELGGRCPK